MQKSIIQVKDIYKSFATQGKHFSVLRGISASFEQGKSYAIKGVSGTGKSTLLHLMAGLHKPSSGTIYYDNEVIHDLSEEKYRRFLSHYMSLVFQKPYLLNELSVVENIMLKGIISGIDKKYCLEKAMQILEMIGLIDKAYITPMVLSGGEQQRVALGRALLLEPKFLLLDEPTAHLDEKGRDRIIELCKELQRISSMGIVLSSHDPIVTGAMDKEFILHNGILV